MSNEDDGTAPAGGPTNAALELVSAGASLALVLFASVVPLTRTGSGSTLSSIEAARLVASVGGNELRIMARAMIVAYVSGLALIPAVAVGGRTGRRIRLAVASVFVAATVFAVVLVRLRVGPAVGLIALAGIAAALPLLIERFRARRLDL